MSLFTLKQGRHVLSSRPHHDAGPVIHSRGLLPAPDPLTSWKAGLYCSSEQGEASTLKRSLV